MKTNFDLLGTSKTLRIAGLALLASRVLSAQATSFHLVDGNASTDISVDTSTGISDLNVDTQNVLNYQWFWVGVGNGAQQTLDPLFVSYSQPDPSDLYTTYTSAKYGFTIGIRYSLSGGSPGSSDPIALNAVYTINNTSAQSLRFYQYADFTLGGVSQIQADYSDALVTAANQNYVDWSISGTKPNHGEAAPFNSTLNNLNSGLLYNLNDNLANTNTGSHATWALQWNVDPNKSIQFSEVSDGELVNPIPEPTTLGLLTTGLFGLGAVGFARRRTR